jgi:uncharacterized protein
MRRYGVRALATLLFCLVWPLMGMATGYDYDAGLVRVADGADLLSSEDERRLDQRIAKIISAYACDAVIVTAADSNGKTPKAYADDFFDYGGYGAGPERDGFLLFIDMGAREFHLSTSGRAIDLLDDREIKYILDNAAPFFTEGNYFGGCQQILADVEQGLQYGSFSGYGPDASSARTNLFWPMAAVIGGSFLVALVTALVMKSGMNRVRPRNSAREYVTPGSFVLRDRKDIYIYKNTIRTPRPRPSSGGRTHRSGGRTHRSAGGTRHGGGGRRF